jgi:hypothetical protein
MQAVAILLAFFVLAFAAFSTAYYVRNRRIALAARERERQARVLGAGAGAGQGARPLKQTHEPEDYSEKEGPYGRR